MRARATILRWALRGAIALAVVLSLVLGVIAVATGTSWGRARVLAAALDAARSSLAGRLEVRELERLSPFGVALRGVSLADPASHEVLSVDAIAAELAPFELLSGRIVARSLTVGPARVDSRELEQADRGLLAALRPRLHSPPAAPGGPPPYVRVDELRLSEITIIAPELAPPAQGVSVRRLEASARFELDGAPELELRSLACELWRDEIRVARVSRASGQLGRPGRPSALELDLELDPALGAARLRLRARGALPEGENALPPFDVELYLGELGATDVARLLADETLATAFRGAVGLELHAQGTVDDVSARATLVSAAGTLGLQAAARQRHLVSLEASAEGLRLGALRDGLPAAPLGFALQASADLAAPGRVPLRLAWQKARLGSAALPDLVATGVWGGRGFEGLDVTLVRGPSTLRLRGAAAVDGLFDLDVLADVRQDALEELSLAAGLPRAPAGALAAELRVARAEGERWRIAGRARAARLAWPGLAASSARADVSLEGPLLGLRGEADVSVDGFTSGGLAVRAARMRLDASGQAFRLRGSGRTERASAALDLRARRQPASMTLWGSASGRFDGLPVELQISETRVGLQGSVETRGVAVDVGGQRLRLVGSYTEPRVRLVASATGVDLAKLAGPLGLAPGWRGRGAVELHAEGPLAAPRVVATLRVRELAREGVAPFGGTLVAMLDVGQRRASLDGVIESGAGSWVDAAFSVATQLPSGPAWWERMPSAEHRAAIEIRALELSELGRWLGKPLPVSGRLTLSSLLSGSAERPAIEASVRGRLTPGVGGGPFSVEQHLAYGAGALDARTAIDDAHGRWLDLRARLELPAGAADDLTALGGRARELADASRWSLSLDAARRSLGALWAAAPAAAQALEATASLQLEHAPGAEPSGRLVAHVAQSAATPPSPGCAPSDVQLDLISVLAAGALELTISAADAGTPLLHGTARAPVLLGPALRGGALTFGSMSGELTSRELELQALPLLCERARGRLDASAHAEDILGAAPVLELDVSAAGLSLGADPRLDLALRGHADRDDAALSIEIGAAGGHGSLRAALPITWQGGRLTLAPDAPLSARAALDRLPIAPLLDPAGALSYASGTLSGSVDVRGTLADPQPSGNIELRDAELTATALAQPLHAVQGRFSFDRRSLVIERFEAHDRDGSLELSGSLERLEKPESLAVKLVAKAKSFPLRQRGQIVATTSGRAEVDATLSGSRSTVHVKLVDADTWLEKFQARTGIDLRAHPDYVTVGAPGAGGPSEPAAAAPEEAALGLVRIDARDRLWIKREDFAVQLSTQLEARIEADETKVKGRVDINRGYIDLMGRVFDVDRDSYLDFTGGRTADPTVSITAKYESRSSGQTVTVRITGRGSKPVLTFQVDDGEVSAGEALEVLVGRRSTGSETSAKQDAASIVQGLTAGLLATSARRELGAAAPIIMIEPGDQTGDGRIRAGFELDALVPSLLRRLITGVYVEGIVEREGSTNAQGQSQQSTTQAGVLVELYFPHQLFTTGQWGPGTSWSLDWGWQL